MTLVWAALSTGAIYSILAITYNVIYTSVGLFNFAQGAILALGTFISYYAADQLKLPSYLAVLLAVVVCSAAGALEARVVLLPKALAHAELLTTVGAATVIVGTIVIIWGEFVRQSTSPISGRIVTVFGGRVDADQFVIIGLAIVMSVGLELWYRFTLRGMASLAVAENRAAAELRGINARTKSYAAFVVAALFPALQPPSSAPRHLCIPNSAIP